ncbi:MAG: DoxX family protein [Acidobacteriota bacterium]
MTKTRKIIYWIATVWLALGMVSTAAGQLLKWNEGQGAVDSIHHLGYPVYLLTILGLWKVLGTIAILVPGTPLIKEWAYAGFFFAMTGAIASHLAVGDVIIAIIPALLLLVLTLVSWYLRPAERTIASKTVA